MRWEESPGKDKYGRQLRCSGGHLHAVPQTPFEAAHLDLLAAGGPIGPNCCQDCCEAIMDILRECSESPEWVEP